MNQAPDCRGNARRRSLAACILFAGYGLAGHASVPSPPSTAPAGSSAISQTRAAAVQPPAFEVATIKPSAPDQMGSRLMFTPDAAPAMAQGNGGGPRSENALTPDNALPSLFAAVQEELGLKLEAAKTQSDVIVIDQIEQPTAN